MFKSLMTKKLNKKGFTLAELLVVVAILAILIAISVPIFTSRIEKARETTDEANIRAAKAGAVAYYLEDGKGFTKYYDAEKGELVTDKATIEKTYGQSSSEVDGATGEPNDKLLQVTVDNSGNVTMEWVAK